MSEPIKVGDRVRHTGEVNYGRDRIWIVQDIDEDGEAVRMTEDYPLRATYASLKHLFLADPNPAAPPAPVCDEGCAVPQDEKTRNEARDAVGYPPQRTPAPVLCDFCRLGEHWKCGLDSTTLESEWECECEHHVPAPEPDAVSYTAKDAVEVLLVVAEYARSQGLLTLFGEPVDDVLRFAIDKLRAHEQLERSCARLRDFVRQVANASNENELWRLRRVAPDYDGKPAADALAAEGGKEKR